MYPSLRMIPIALVLTLASCEKDYDYNLDDPPVVTISSPTEGDLLCPTVEAMFTVAGSEDGLELTCAIDDEAAEPCTSPVTSFELLGPGEHTLTVYASNDFGDGEPVTVSFTVDAVAPEIDLTATAGAANSGTATLTVALTGDDDDVTVEAGLELATSETDRVRVPSSCTCTGLSCACTGLAAGTNRLAATATDACGNAATATEDVSLSAGPYLGHAVLIGHDYSDDNTPDQLGNAVALAPLADGRTSPRIVAWRSASVPGATVTNATVSIDTVLTAGGLTFDRTSTTDYVEVSDPLLLADTLRGRDVLVLYEPGVDHDDDQLDAIADIWADDLAAFTAAGGVVVSLHSDHGWRLLAGGATPLINITGGYGLGGVGGLLSPDYIRARYPASALGTAGYSLLAGVEDSYDTPAGSGCVTVEDSAATVVAEHIGGSCGDGCFYSACDAMVDLRLPRYQIDITPTFDVDPYPACVPDGVGLDSAGSFAVTVPGGQPAPTGTFECTYAPRPGYLQSPDPIEACTVTSQGNGTYSIAMASAARDGYSSVDITLVENGTPVRTGRATIYVDDYMFVSYTPVADNSCSVPYLLREYRPPVDATCGQTLPSYLAVQSVSCILERETTPGVWTQIGSHAGVACGATPSAGGGFASNSYTMNWSADIVAAGASGTLRHTVTATDYHGNTDSRGDTWTLSSPSICGG